MSVETSSSIRLDGKQLETGYWAAGTASETILLIHEALGSVSYWKSFPEKLVAATGHNVLAYSRAGHGKSEGPVEIRSIDYYRNQVDVVLPGILAHFSIEQPVLYGHSEGAAIALLYAAQNHPVRAIVAECPILVQEERTVRTIQQLEAAYPNSDMSQKLSRYHQNADAVFHAWMQSNRSTIFQDFPMQQYLQSISCPVLVLQGERDEFGSARQFESLRQAIPAAAHRMFDAGHLLHREQPDLVAASVHSFLLATTQQATNEIPE